jgi:DNA repair photolyase
MSGEVIYEPKGRALEYAELACNPWIGCVHGCLYCYGPASFRVKRENWSPPILKANFLERFEKDAYTHRNDPREILFSFATDPCGTTEQVEVMDQVLDIAELYELRLTILTKNPLAARPLLIRMARLGWKLGTTICFLSEELRAAWEPDAPPIAERAQGIRIARARGVSTWVSVEPVVDLVQGLAAVRVAREDSDMVKVGHWNHDVRAKVIDWKAFHAAASEILGDHPHLFKHDLLVAAGVKGAK